MNTICGAKTRGTGAPCQRYPKENGRCRLHGGLSTGPRTMEGIMRIKESNTKHGNFTKGAFSERRAFRELIRGCRECLFQ